MTDMLFLLPPWGEHLDAEAGMEFAENSSPPLNLGYLAAYLRDQEGFTCAIEDLRLYSPDHAMAMDEMRSVIAEILKAHSPTLIGITSITQIYPSAKELVKIIKELLPQTVVVGGGIHATFCYRELLDDGFDFVVTNEGEESLRGLAKSLIRKQGRVQDVPGLNFRVQDKVISNPPAKLIPLDRLPFPARDLMKMERYMQKGAIITARGCPYTCYFCVCPNMYFGEHRRRSPEGIVNEMGHMMDLYSVKEFTFHDDTFCLNGKRTESLCRAIRDRFRDIIFGCQTRVDTVDLRMAMALARAGCQTVQFGVESGNQRILDQMKKRITLEQALNAVRACIRAGIRFVGCNLMIGHPDDTEETVLDTIEFGTRLLEVGATNIGLSLMTPLPGAKPYEQAKELGITIHTDPRFASFSKANISTRNLSKDELSELYAIGVGVFRNRMERKAPHAHEVLVRPGHETKMPARLMRNALRK